jgi:hypothetical protein
MYGMSTVHYFVGHGGHDMTDDTKLQQQPCSPLQSL